MHQFKKKEKKRGRREKKDKYRRNVTTLIQLLKKRGCFDWRNVRAHLHTGQASKCIYTNNFSTHTSISGHICQRENGACVRGHNDTWAYRCVDTHHPSVATAPPPPPPRQFKDTRHELYKRDTIIATRLFRWPIRQTTSASTLSLPAPSYMGISVWTHTIRL